MSEGPMLEKMRPTPPVEIPVFNKLKRKRADSADPGLPQRAQEHKKPRPEDTSHLQPLNTSRTSAKTDQTSFTQTPGTGSAMTPLADARDMQTAQTVDDQAQSISPLFDTNTAAQHEQPASPMDTTGDALMADAPVSASEDANGFTPVQQVIENEFNMQILMKHNELRLIEQELAKCQVALEQLRRCELRPFPGSDRPSEAVSSGTGPAVFPPPGYTRPSHPAPYGVTDGPYSQHYKQWLLRDPQFDAMSIQAMQMEAASRPTRNSGSARKSISSKQFAFPGRPGDNHQSIPNYPTPAPKDKNSPLVLRRSTDGQLVKLICNNCLRGNFSSIQGFLNHCRIAHKVDYKSHDAAAVDCGRTLDENEAANLPAETHAQPAPPPAPKPSVGRPAANTAPTPTVNRNLVHPFNTATGASMALDTSQQSSAAPRQPVKSLSSAAQSTAESPLTPSPQVPRLSAHFAKHQMGGDLAKATANAKQKVDLGYDEDLPSPDISLPNSPVPGAPGSRKVIGSKPASASRKGLKPTVQQRPRPSPLAPAPADAALKQEHREIPESPQDHGLNLSPHTADSNPGLVSDHEDDDDQGSASEEESPQEAPAIRRPLPVPTGSCADNMEIDVAVDDIDQDGVIIRRNSMFAEEERGLHGAGGSPSKKFGGVGKRSG